MPEDFQQTVDLRDKLEKRRQPPPKKFVTPLEKIYREEEAIEPLKNLQRISRPEPSRPRGGLVKSMVFLLAILAVVAATYLLFFRQKEAAAPAKEKNWYAVKLVDGMVYYGQIFDLKASPVVIANVYYDYDRDKAIKEKKAFVETGNLRLVKMGKEVQGGNGSMLVYPNSGWPIMEPLKPDSKVLQAILQYEK